MSKETSHTKEKGRSGEEIACQFLKAKEFEIKHRNWQFGRYEIDIVAENKEAVVFVEVKFRTSRQWGDPELFVSNKQKTHLVRAANRYLQTKNIQKEARFDVIGIVRTDEHTDIRHIEDAFKPRLNIR